MSAWPIASFVRRCALTNDALLQEIRARESRDRTPSETDDLVRLYDELLERLDDPYDRSIGNIAITINAR